MAAIDKIYGTREQRRELKRVIRYFCLRRHAVGATAILTINGNTPVTLPIGVLASDGRRNFEVTRIINATQVEVRQLRGRSIMWAVLMVLWRRLRP